MTKSIQEIMDGMPTGIRIGHVSQTDDLTVVILEFSEKGFGFGEVTIVQTKHGVFLDTERMGVSRCLKYVEMLLASGVTDADMDPARHALYNREMGRSCADGCEACAAAPPVEHPDDGKKEPAS
ncbi:MAG TPA: hypothetical protein VFA98_09370 [Thermoanaerobaculia bacterium]|nr:hypothetical protein [Thermoanaerobaculia bacterium]